MMTLMRSGLMRDLRKICQDFSRAMNLADRVRDDLHVHSVPLVFRRLVGPAVPDAVALCERAVQEDEVQGVRAQCFQQARCLLGEQAGDRGHVRVGGCRRVRDRPDRPRPHLDASCQFSSFPPLAPHLRGLPVVVQRLRPSPPSLTAPRSRRS
jgi:hypothetical protein